MTCSRPPKQGERELEGGWCPPWPEPRRLARRSRISMDNTTVLSWNVRDLNAQARRDNVRTLVDDIRPSIVCLQETKLDVISEFLVAG